MTILDIQRISWVVKLITGSLSPSARRPPCRSRLASIVVVSSSEIQGDYRLTMIKSRC